MSAKWISTKFKGVRYYEHPIRKHGVGKDKYLSIRYQRDGKRIEEGIGWTSELDPKDNKKWSPEKAALVLAELKEAAKGLKQGPSRLSERRADDDKRKEDEKAEQGFRKQEAITFNEIFKKRYFPICQQNKTKRAWATEDSLFKLWIDPVIGALPLKSISPIHLERIKNNMGNKGRAPRSINYVLSVIRQVYNYSRRNNLYSGFWPGSNKAVKIPKNDNRRQRYLTHEEAGALLAGLKAISSDIHDMALLSLNCGLRAGEIFSLTWADVEIKKKMIFIRDPKNKRNRHAYMTNEVKTMLTEREQGKMSDNIFIRRSAKDDPKNLKRQVDRISKTFNRVVTALNLNKDITDTRQKVVFHSLRHTYASWLVESGVNLYTVQKLLGHENISMTERYSHLSPDTLQDAVRTLEKSIDHTGQDQKVVNISG